MWQRLKWLTFGIVLIGFISWAHLGVLAQPVAASTTLSGAAPVYQLAQTHTAEAVDPVGESVSDPVNVEDTCEFRISGLGGGWIICWVLNGLSEGINNIESVIDDFLVVERSDYHGDITTDDQTQSFTYRDAWRNIRNFMTFAVVGTALFMVISTALDFGPFSNYTVKKYLPRLVIGTILIQLSWPLGDFMIQAFNQVGDVLRALLFSSFPGAVDHSLDDIFDGGGLTTMLGGAGVAAGFYFGWATLLPIAFTALMMFLFGFLFLVAREYIIILLLILSPLGLALWVLPGNDRAWNFYFKTFFYLLLIYPIIVLIITAGKIFSYLILL